MVDATRQTLECPACSHRFAAPENSGDAQVRCPACSRIVVAGAKQHALEDVFLCHSVKDLSVVNAVLDSLESKKIRCWIAPRDIAPGENWAGAIVQAIGRSRMLLIVLSANSNASQQVLREVERAVNRKIPILALYVDDTTLSGDLEYFLSGCHRERMDPGSVRKAIKRLPKRVRAVLSHQGDFLGVQPADGQNRADRFSLGRRAMARISIPAIGSLDRRAMVRISILAIGSAVVSLSVLGMTNGWFSALTAKVLTAKNSIEVTWVEMDISRMTVITRSPENKELGRAYLSFNRAAPGTLYQSDSPLGATYSALNVVTEHAETADTFGDAMSERGFWYSDKINKAQALELMGRYDPPTGPEATTIEATKLSRQDIQDLIDILNENGIDRLGCVSDDYVGTEGFVAYYTSCRLVRLME